MLAAHGKQRILGLLLHHPSSPLLRKRAQGEEWSWLLLLTRGMTDRGLPGNGDE